MSANIQLTDSEWRVMRALWDNGPCSLRALCDSLKDTGWSANAVISFIKRLEQKGAAGVSGERRNKLYHALIERSDATAFETESLIDRVFGGDMHLMMQTAVSSRRISDEEADELIRILQNGRDA